MPRPRRRTLVAGIVLATTLFGTACGNSSTSTQGASTSTTPPTVPTSVPAGTELRIGDQTRTLELPLALSGEIKQLQATPKWASFVGGPPLLEAFRAGELDVGYVGDTPPILAAAQGQDLVVIGAWRFTGDNFAVVVPPGSSVTSVSDLAGKRLAYQRGTALQAYAVRALKDAGLKESDVEVADVSTLDVVSTLTSGSVDAGVVVEPLLSTYLNSTPGARRIRDSRGLTTNLALIVSTRAALDKPATAAAIGDLLARERAAFAWRAQNPEEFIKGFADANKVPVELARKLVESNAGIELLKPSGAVINDLQALADDLADARVIPRRIDVSSLADRRYESLLG